MSEDSISKKLCQFHAYNLAENFKLKQITGKIDDSIQSFNSDRILYRFGKSSYCFVYKFGSVVFFNVGPDNKNRMLQLLEGFSSKESGSHASDEYYLEEVKGEKTLVFFDRMVTDKISQEKIEIMASVLAQSTALEYFEIRVEELMTKLAELTLKIEKKKYRIRSISEKRVLSLINMTMTIRQRIISSVYILEKPEETWEDKTLDDLHRDASLMFEIKDRFKTIDYKLDIARNSLEMFSNMTSNRRMIVLEAAIVVLFIIDIILVVSEMVLS